jgi:hypothetical protein
MVAIEVASRRRCTQCRLCPRLVRWRQDVGAGLFLRHSQQHQRVGPEVHKPCETKSTPGFSLLPDVFFHYRLATPASVLGLPLCEVPYGFVVSHSPSCNPSLALLLFDVALPGRGSRSIVAPCIMSTRYRSSFSLCNKLVASSAESPRAGASNARGSCCLAYCRVGLCAAQ